MAYQPNNQRQGGGQYQRQQRPQFQGGGNYQQGGFNRPRKGWNKIHEAMFDELLKHPRMSQRTGEWLESMKSNPEPTNNQKSFLCQCYAEWCHRPNKDIVIRAWEDRTQPQQQQRPQNNAPQSEPDSGNQPADEPGNGDESYWTGD